MKNNIKLLYHEDTIYEGDNNKYHLIAQKNNKDDIAYNINIEIHENESNKSNYCEIHVSDRLPLNFSEIISKYNNDTITYISCDFIIIAILNDDNLIQLQDNPFLPAINNIVITVDYE